MNEDCNKCLWSCGTYDTMHNQSKLYCIPEGYIVRHKVADGICEYYKRGAGCDEPEQTLSIATAKHERGEGECQDCVFGTGDSGEKKV